MTWETLLAAVEMHTITAPIEEFAQYDSERLLTASNNLLCRLQEAEDKKNGKS